MCHTLEIWLIWCWKKLDDGNLSLTKLSLQYFPDCFILACVTGRVLSLSQLHMGNVSIWELNTLLKGTSAALLTLPLTPKTPPKFCTHRFLNRDPGNATTHLITSNLPMKGGRGWGECNCNRKKKDAADLVFSYIWTCAHRFHSKTRILNVAAIGQRPTTDLQKDRRFLVHFKYQSDF